MLRLKATADEMTLAENFLSTVPVSFTYDGLPFADNFTGSSGDFVSKDGKTRVTFPFDTFEDSAAVEWVPRFSAAGNQPTAQIRDIYALDRRSQSGQILPSIHNASPQRQAIRDRSNSPFGGSRNSPSPPKIAWHNVDSGTRRPRRSYRRTFPPRRSSRRSL